jgi:DnaJ-class molecular chaperone
MQTTTETHTMPTYGPRTCRRCKGTGQHSNYGGDTRCFNCKGTGIEQVENGRRPLTAEELASVERYQAGIAAREAREAARKARREARA